jgi:O-antigen ligase
MTTAGHAAPNALSRSRAYAPNWRRSRLHDVVMWAVVVVCALAPLPLGSNRPFFWAVNAAAVGLVALVYGLRMLRMNEEPRDGLQTLGLLFLVLMGFIAFQLLPLGGLFGSISPVDPGLVPPSVSVTPGATLLVLLQFATYGLLFFLVVAVAGESGRRQMMLNLLVAVVAIYAVVGIVSLHMGDTILGFEKWGYRGSATGTFVNRNSFATFLAFGTIIAFTQILHHSLEWSEARAEGDHRRLPISVLALYVIALVICIVVLIATQSRMGFAAALAGAGAVATLGSLHKRGRRAVVLPIVVLFVLLAVTGIAIYGGGLLERLEAVEESGAQRIDLYAQVVELISMRPMVGFGAGSFDQAFQLVHRAPVSTGLVWDKAHNTYLALWSELGVVFGTIPMLMVLLVALRMLSALWGGRGSWRAQAAVLGVAVAGALHSLVDFSLEIQANALLFVALLGIGWAASPGTGRRHP